MPGSHKFVALANVIAESACVSIHLKVICTKQSQIKTLTALMGQLSLSVGWENGPERGLKTVIFYMVHLTSCN